MIQKWTQESMILSQCPIFQGAVAAGSLVTSSTKARPPILQCNLLRLPWFGMAGSLTADADRSAAAAECHQCLEAIGSVFFTLLCGYYF